MDPHHYRDLVRPLVAGRRLILAGAPLAAYPRVVRELRDLGAERPLLVVSTVGTGELPSDEEAEWVDLGVEASTMMEGFRRTAALLERPPPEVREAVARYDPDRRAMVLGSPFLPRPELCERRVYGYRRKAWLALEDKVVVDRFWDRAGIPRAESEVVAAEGGPLWSAHVRLDRGLGTVWQGDAAEGFNGGAEYLRWVRDAYGADRAVRFFAEHCRRVRVAPFSEGIPCSIHGMVFPEAVAVFRPVEILTLRPRDDGRLRYCGTASFWDPAPEDRAFMRSVARRVGETLRAKVEYRGAFTVDGIMTAEGFRPTELNTRAGAGMGCLTRAFPELPLGLLNLAVMEGERWDFRPEELAGLVVEAADQRRGGGGMAVVEAGRESTEERAVVWEGEGYREAGEDEEPDGTLAFGPSDVGGFLRFTPEPDQIPVGPSLAPRVVAALALADRVWEAGVGELAPAEAVR